MKSALLIVDAQVNMFEEGSAVHNSFHLLKTIERMVTQARDVQIPVIYVQNNGKPGDPDQTDSPGWHIHDRVSPQEGDIVVQKRTPDAFCETQLASILNVKEIGRLIITGVQTENCISSTCHHARIAGYSITLVKDGHSTFDSDVLTAEQIIAHYNDILGDFADVTPAGQVRF
ncbi:MAG: cysteine hydrolase family protein [Gemmatimonadota bacterium]|nr:cysteine hydrolase family protein [Gemmatimonadota bacterium]